MGSYRYKDLDALRGLAAVMVLIFHFECCLVFHLPDGPADPTKLWFHYALMGVELFFVISGFVILMTLEAAPSIASFAVNRFARLYPAYWLSVLVGALYLRPLHETSFTVIAVNLTMLQNFIG